MQENRLSVYENFDYIAGRAERGEAGGKEFIYGPSSGGMLESIRFRMSTEGERISSLVPEFSFKNRSLKLGGKDAETALLLAERINGPYSASYSALFCGVAESILGIQPSHEVRLTRMLACELERIACHLFVVGRLCEAASQSVATAHIFGLREKILRMISRRFGHRFFFGLNDIGRIRTPVDFHGISESVDAVVNEFGDLWQHLSSSTLFIDRIQRTCPVHLESSVGPAARASGYSTDERLTEGLLPYSDFSFNFRKEYEGDSLSRALIRSHEIEESGSIIAQVTDQLHKADASRPASISDRRGEGIGRIESPGGETLLYLRLGDSIERAYIRSSSLANLQAFVRGISGAVFTDFAFAWESFGLWVCEMGGVI